MTGRNHTHSADSRSATGEISRKLIQWFERNKRDLAFRRTSDPYRIWISEVMLQQTTVAAVMPYYERFLIQFPTVRDLARASEQQVLTAWAGLGYYRRAKLLHAAARKIVEEHGGKLPPDIHLLQKLPGFGRYTAGAVGSFAFGLSAPIVEANSARVLARLFMIPEIASGGARSRLWELAENLVPKKDARAHNYALMELGSLICRPGTPHCVRCPVAKHCAARAVGRQDEIPAPAVRKSKVEKRFLCVVAGAGKRFGVRSIPAGEWHAGMFEFPKIEQSESQNVKAALFTGEFPELKGLRDVRPLKEFHYTVTNHSVTLSVFRGNVSGRDETPGRKAQNTRKKGLPGTSLQWMTLEEIARLPMGAAQRRLLKFLMNDNGNRSGAQ
jgi:A/G-specific adenine glycosylase